MDIKKEEVHTDLPKYILTMRTVKLWIKFPKEDVPFLCPQVFKTLLSYKVLSNPFQPNS